MSKKRSGRVLTVFVVIAAILLLSCTALAIFFFQVELSERKRLQTEVADLQRIEKQFKEEIVDYKKQIFLLEEKNKEADTRINDLLDDLDLQEGLRDEMKKEMTSLREKLDEEVKAKEKIKQQLTQYKDENEIKVRQLEGQLEKMEEMTDDEQSKSDAGEVDLEKIVVSSEEDSPGKILMVDRETDFVIINLGKKHGVREGKILEVYRSEKLLGEIQVTSVHSDISAADVIPPFSIRSAKANDQVVIK